MKLVKTEDAVGHVLCHDITQIIKDEKKGPVFRKGHVITKGDIPILLSVGKDNIYIFGQRAKEVQQHLEAGYESRRYMEGSRRLKETLETLKKGFNGQSFKELYDYLLNPTYSIADPYMCLYDFEDYCKVSDEITRDYKDRKKWAHKSVTNIAMASHFAADRAVKEYADDIWESVPVVEK